MRSQGCASVVFRIAQSLFLALSLTLPAAAAQSDGKSVTYQFGVVPQFNAERILAIWQPILLALEKETGLRFRLSGSDSIPAFEKEFSAGRFDFVYMNPYHFVRARRSQGYQPLLRDVGEQIYGIVVVRKDSLLQSVKDLDGKTVAFPAPNALAASMMPRAEFRNVHHIEVRPVYVNSHSSVYLNVMLGRMDAGGGVQKTLDEQPPEVREALRIIHRTQKVVPHPVAAHPRVPAEIRDRVREGFLAMGRTAPGRKLLAEVPIKTIGPAAMAEYQPLEALGLEAFYTPD